MKWELQEYRIFEFAKVVPNMMETNSFTSYTATYRIIKTGAIVHPPTSGPNFYSDPDSVNFGDVDIGRNCVRSVEIINGCSTNNLIISAANVTPGFTLLQKSFPITVEAGKSTKLDIAFKPLFVGYHTGNITISHNAQGGITTIPITANGIDRAGAYQFKANITLTNAFGVIVCTLGISGGGTLINNTINIDRLEEFGEFQEMSALVDQSMSRFEARFSPPPGYNPYLFTGGMYMDYRGFEGLTQVDTFRILLANPPASLYPTKITWPCWLNLFGTAWTMKPQNGTSWPITNMLKSTDLTIPEDANHQILIIRNALAMSSGWNLVSSPLIRTDNSSDVVFPGKSGNVYSYNAQTQLYESAATIEIGKGYWVNYQNPTPLPLSGTEPGTISVQASQGGWMLIGSRNTAIELSSLLLDNGGIIIGSAYWYNGIAGLYEKTTVINPGEAAWIYVSKACTITLPQN
jgi:hypothetical protein